MSWLTENLTQTIVYWGNPTPDGYGGFTFDTAVELSARWEERSELFINESGQEARSSAVVFLADDVELGGFLFLGELSDLDSAWSVPDEAKQIRGFRKVPNIEANLFERKAWL